MIKPSTGFHIKIFKFITSLSNEIEKLLFITNDEILHKNLKFKGCSHGNRKWHQEITKLFEKYKLLNFHLVTS